LPAGFDKEEALRQFEQWLESPEGTPPIPHFTPEPPAPGVICSIGDYVPCPEGQYREEFKDAQGCFVYGECLTGYVPGPFPPPDYQKCPFVDYVPCPEGQYREEFKDEQGCFVFGECQVIPGFFPQPIPIPFPEDPATACANEGGTWDPATSTCTFAGFSLRLFLANILEASLNIFR